MHNKVPEDIKSRLIYLGYFILAVFLVFAFRLWQFQILNGKQYLAMSENNRLKVLRVAAPRGIIYDRNGKALVKNMPYYSASLISRAVSKVDTSKLAKLLSMSEEEISEKLSADVPVFGTIKLKEGIPFKEVAYIEARRSDIPGLIIEPEVARFYVYGNVASHVVGYLGMPSPDKLASFKNSDLPPDAFIGKWGIEAYFDSRLRGTAGKKFVEVDALGRQLRVVREEKPIKGEDVTISIDIDLQKKLEEGYKGRNGAAVALNPNTGEILAMVSLPSFNPNLFSRGISSRDWETLNEDPDHPFLNRAVQSQYPPGSTFKTVLATAALEENALPPDFKVNCAGKISYGKWDFRCWKHNGHGKIGLHTGLVESCDVFFYTVGNILGIDKIAEYAEKLGLNRKTGVQFADEKSGCIPSVAWKLRTRKRSWYLGDTYHASIGQGYVLTTPVQLATMMAAVANGGVVYQPKITPGTEDAVVIRKNNFKPETVKFVKEALRDVVNGPHGTAGIARSKYYVISGKTGTAQVVSLTSGKKGEYAKDHAWFTAFAPFDHPEIAMSVLVEHGGHGGSAAAPIAKMGIEEYLNDEAEREGKKVPGYEAKEVLNKLREVVHKKPLPERERGEIHGNPAPAIRPVPVIEPEPAVHVSAGPATGEKPVSPEITGRKPAASAPKIDKQVPVIKPEPVVHDLMSTGTGEKAVGPGNPEQNQPALEKTPVNPSKPQLPAGRENPNAD